MHCDGTSLIRRSTKFPRLRHHPSFIDEPGASMNTRTSLIAIGLGLLAFSVGAAEKVTERTLKLSAGEKSPPATLADMKWLAGHWVGEAFGGRAEELWAEPAGANMAGLYRLVKGEKTLF